MNDTVKSIRCSRCGSKKVVELAEATGYLYNKCIICGNQWSNSSGDQHTAANKHDDELKPPSDK